MATPSAPRDDQPRNESTKSNEPNDADNDTDEGTASAMLDRETYGQTLDPERDGQQQADQMDDSLRSEHESTGPAPASDENIPSQLTDPSDRAFTLPEEQV